MDGLEVGESTRMEDVVPLQQQMANDDEVMDEEDARVVDKKEDELDVEEEIDQIFELAVDLTRLFAGWSTEGTEGIEDTVQRVVAARRSHLLKRMKVTEDPFGELQLLINIESAVITFGKNPNKRMAIISFMPGFPPFNALGALKQWLHKIEDEGYTTTVDARAALQEISKMKNPYPIWLQILSVALLSMSFAIDVNPNWEAAIVALIFGVGGGILFQTMDWGKTWAVFLAFTASFLIAFPIMLLYRYDVVKQSPGLLFVCPLFLFIPGDTITTQAIEIMSGYWSNGVARLFNAIIQLVFLAFGALLAALVTGYDEEVLDPDSSKTEFSWWYVRSNMYLIRLSVLCEP